MKSGQQTVQAAQSVGLRLKPTAMFDLGFYYVYRGLTSKQNESVEITPINNEKVYGARFKQNDMQVDFYSPATDTKNLENASGAFPLEDVLAHINTQKSNNPRHISIVPLAEANQWRQHWTFLIIHGDKAYFYDTKSRFGSFYYSLKPLQNILEKNKFSLNLHNVSYSGIQPFTNTTHCGYICSWMMGNILHGLKLHPKVDIDKVLTAPNLWKKKPTMNKLAHKVNYGHLPNVKEIDGKLKPIVSSSASLRGCTDNTTLSITPFTVNPARLENQPSFWQRHKRKIVGILLTVATILCAIFFPPALIAVGVVALPMIKYAASPVVSSAVTRVVTAVQPSKTSSQPFKGSMASNISPSLSIDLTQERKEQKREVDKTHTSSCGSPEDDEYEVVESQPSPSKSTNPLEFKN